MGLDWVLKKTKSKYANFYSNQILEWVYGFPTLKRANLGYKSLQMSHHWSKSDKLALELCFILADERMHGVSKFSVIKREILRFTPPVCFANLRSTADSIIEPPNVTKCITITLVTSVSLQASPIILSKPVSKRCRSPKLWLLVVGMSLVWEQNHK